MPSQPSQLSDKGLTAVANAIRAIPGWQERLSDGIARAVDEVVDPIRSGRWRIADLDRVEKTVLGIRVENVLRMELEVPRGARLDLLIAGEEVDVKFTMAKNWMIPPEARDHLCLVTSYSPNNHDVSAGLVRASSGNLTAGKNRDHKSSVSKAGKTTIEWLIDRRHPGRSIIGFMANLDPETRQLITDSSVGAQVRLNRLFVRVKNVPIPEAVVQAVAVHHFDWTRRLAPTSRTRSVRRSSGTRYSARVRQPIGAEWRRTACLHYVRGTACRSASSVVTTDVRRALIQWGKKHARRFPWRSADAYGVAVAEVLLQKTRGEAVEPSWERLIRHYPDHSHLARARTATLVRLVAPLGLGEQRARRLTTMARSATRDEPLTGLGPYGRAVVALTSGQRTNEAPVDGNVARVLSRVTGWSWERGEPRKKPELRALAVDLMSGPPRRGLAVLYALVDLGALICTPRNPHCPECPLVAMCVSARV